MNSKHRLKKVERKGFFRLQQVKKNQPRITCIPVNHQGPLPDIA